jgi:IS1 family transposase
MNRLSTEQRAQIVAALVEGNSIRSIVRMFGFSKNTIAKLIVELGAACSKYMSENLVNLPCKRVQVDEIWSFVYAKQKNVTPEILSERIAGDVWTWVAMDADTKLVCSWLVGPRDTGTATEFMQDLAGRLAHRVQLTSDGHKPYLVAVSDAFGSEIDYAMLVKIYGEPTEGQKRYSPADCLGCKKENKIGNPDPKHISTSYIERQNLTMRMSMRRFTRLTNAFSKKIENHVASLAIHYMHYNFVRITPAMAAGVTQKLWSVVDVAALLD